MNPAQRASACPAAEWTDRMPAAGIPAGPLLTSPEAFGGARGRQERQVLRAAGAFAS